MSLNVAKVLAGLGVIFGIFGYIPHVGWFFGLIGVILFLIGIYNISNILKNSKIFKYFLISIVFGFVSIVIFAIVIFAGMMNMLSEHVVVPFGQTMSYNYETTDYDFEEVHFEMPLSSMTSNFIISFITFAGLMIVAVIYKIKAYRLLSKYLSLNIFDMAASFYKWGAILVVVMIGIVLILIGDILAAVGFFSIPENLN
ncbi:DUF996 domain-containing protein [Thermosipho atlanticus]|uniref:Uncharacterized membrane protein n=1 Tax=Thermosipho atlanticus DSM 15807 TaxID=1123380 RepID=A0A1M5R5V6_9BACT|nr:DUF996 domain-containing protein [Thermosipho atlanticus]SHH21578.1 Uncharacterized membrane protein [Thermosipho atlanticus DSM 15807]